MHDHNYDSFQKFFSYLKDKGIINIEENSDLLTEYLQKGNVTFNNLSEKRAKEAKALFKKYAKGELKIE